MDELQFIRIDLENEVHNNQLLFLLNAYMEDEMGMGHPMPDSLKPVVLLGLKKHAGYCGFFVFHSGRFIALANCNLNFSTFVAMPLLNIHDFFVLSEFRHKGVGIFLLQNIAEYATECGCSKITLEVREDNLKAQKLYRKVGFSAGNPPYSFWEKSLR